MSILLTCLDAVGTLPSLDDASSLTTLIANHNNFNDKNLDLTPLKDLKILDLAHNQFSGDLKLGNVDKLARLFINHNSFTARLPDMSKTLTDCNVYDNNRVGKNCFINCKSPCDCENRAPACVSRCVECSSEPI
jgi:Leucine-rich repeat (LRR) protein